MVEQLGMDLADQPQRQGEAAAQPGEPVLERRDVAADLAHVLDRHRGLLVDLVEQQVGDRRARALDHRGQHRFLAHEGVQQQLGIRQEVADGVEPPDRHQRVVEAPSQIGRPRDRRPGRQRRRREGAHRLA
jgi:hypothetical protein